MPLPANLVSLIDQSHLALAGDPVHDLRLGYRRAIWAALGPRGSAALACAESLGWRRRVDLASESVRFVLPLWNAHWPDDDTPRWLLSAAHQVLLGTLNRLEAEQIRQRWFDVPLPENASRDQQIAWEVLHAADQVLAAALWDERFDPGDVDLAVTDLDVNPDELDASYFAAFAYSGGGIWEKKSNSSRRRFWEWWLTIAVPNAIHGVFG